MPLFNPSGGASISPLTFFVLTLGTGITSFGSPYASTPGAALDQFGVVHLIGLITGTAASNSIVATLPSALMYPSTQRAVVACNANVSNGTHALTIRTDGTIRNAGAWNSDLASLDDITYPVS